MRMAHQLKCSGSTLASFTPYQPESEKSAAVTAEKGACLLKHFDVVGLTERFGASLDLSYRTIVVGAPYAAASARRFCSTT